MMHYGLLIMCLLVILPNDVLMVSSRGYFIKLGDDYKDVILQDSVVDANKKIIKGANTYGEENSDVPECARHCIKEGNCKTFTIRTMGDIKYCYISSKSICNNPAEVLQISKPVVNLTAENRIGVFLSDKSYHTYDVRKADETRSTMTCSASCLLENSCDECGRQNCSGPKCDQCLTDCWSIAPIDGLTTFWPDFTHPRHVRCKGPWQVVFGTRSTLRYWKELQEMDLVLQLEVYCDLTNTFHFSYFDSFKLVGMQLSVGEYIGGEAGNFWNAPFSARERTNFTDSNCEPFWNGLNDCEVTSIDSYDTQIANNVTHINRKPKWHICPGTNDCNAGKITMRISKKTEEIMQATYPQPSCTA